MGGLKIHSFSNTSGFMNISITTKWLFFKDLVMGLGLLHLSRQSAWALLGRLKFQPLSSYSQIGFQIIRGTPTCSGPPRGSRYETGTWSFVFHRTVLFSGTPFSKTTVFITIWFPLNSGFFIAKAAAVKVDWVTGCLGVVSVLVSSSVASSPSSGAETCFPVLASPWS